MGAALLERCVRCVRRACRAAARAVGSARRRRRGALLESGVWLGFAVDLVAAAWRLLCLAAGRMRSRAGLAGSVCVPPPCW